MKLSKGLLQEEDFGEKIFRKSLNKAKELLTEIFGIDFNKSDPRILNIMDASKAYRYEVVFDIEGREITALFNFEEDCEDLLSEVLRIKETVIENVPLLDKKDSYNEIINKAMDYLEEKYDIDFTPLDIEEENKNILNVEHFKDKSWVAKFISDNYESEFKAEYNFKQEELPYLTITQFKHHIIYL